MPRLSSCFVLVLALLLVPSARAEGIWRPGKYRAGLRTRDDTRVALYKYVPDGGQQASRGRLLLFPDVGMTHRVFDVYGRGLAPFLMRRGFEVFVVEYRGAGASEVPLGGFGFEALVEGDGEAAFAQATSGRERIFLGGLGLGGTIAFVLAGRHPEKVAGVIGLQAAITLDVPNEPIGRMLGRLEEAGPWIDLSELLQRPLFYGRTWFEIMLASDRSVPAHELGELRRLTIARAAAKAGYDYLGGPKRFFIAGEENGFRHDYGHVDLIIGERADEELWPRLLSFLDEHAPTSP
ncbi:MAG: alpha/beta fold hydrolase [Myxococcales bacterium]|jgi:pimeloyl-ACP methyl ester carboxylesterase